MAKQGHKVLLYLYLLMLVGLSTAAAQTEEYASANKFYEQKDYESAIRIYESILLHYGESAPLYFNMGNAFFKSGDLGHAVLYYSRARRLDPADEDILANLEFAGQFTNLQMEGVQLNPVHALFESIVASYRIGSLAWFSSALFILLMAVLTVRFGLGLNAAWVRASAVGIVVLLIVSVGLTTFKYRVDNLTRRAVIIAEESPVHTGASELSDIELQGAPGLVIEILSESNDYYNVQFENKRRGWLKKDFVAEI